MFLEPPGFYGKVPARGDFLSCRLTPAAAAPWDTWLGHVTLAVREAAGPDWPEAWLTAPLWHFTLGPGVLAETAMAGVWVASVDRVGRMFPFTILGPSAGEPDPSWSQTVEALMLGALDDTFEPPKLDAALAQLGPPQTAIPVPAGQTIWCCRGSDRVEPGRLDTKGLPSGASAVAMILGRTVTPPPPSGPSNP